MEIVIIILTISILGLGYYTLDLIKKLDKEKLQRVQAENKMSSLSYEDKIKLLDEESKRKLKAAEKEAENILESARKQLDSNKKQIGELENTLKEREKILSQKNSLVEEKQKELEEKLNKTKQIETEIETEKSELTKKLEEIAKLNKEEAKDLLFKQLKEAHETEVADGLRTVRKRLETESDKLAQEIIINAMNNAGTDYVSEFTTTLFPIPSKEIKGKIIGKEGRNIKSFEKLTGVQILLDDEDENNVQLSCFDPLRRELAKIALTRLVKDGRINPAKIEQSIQKARDELARQIIKDGEEIAIKAGFNSYSLDHYKYLGRMKYRYSYGQSLAVHTLEVVNFAGKAAAELGLNEKLAKECALWHDIGKVESHEKEGDHMELGEQIGKKLGLNNQVLNAMYSHHMKKEPTSMESAIIYIADAQSGGRPGARYGTVEDYLQRIRALEDIANSFAGVKQAYAIDAGREVRVFVDPVTTTDDRLLILADEIAKQIQTKERYPGSVKVIVIRENQAEAMAN